MIAIENGHVVERPVRPLPWPAAADLAEQLAREGIDVLIEAGPIVHVTALVCTTTEQEQRVLAAVMALTDSRVAWHGAVA